MSIQVDRSTKMNQQSNSKKESDNVIKFKKLFSHKKHKHEDNRSASGCNVSGITGGVSCGNSSNRQFSRKRSQSNSGGKFFLPYSNYKRRKMEGVIIPPTKFLLGGNICDPLNLNSMQDEEVNRAMNAVTPKSSPLPIPRHKKEEIEVIIPPNICDPLNLTCNDNEEYEKQLLSPLKKTSKRKNRKRKRSCLLSNEGEDLNEMPDIQKLFFYKMMVQKPQTEQIESNETMSFEEKNLNDPRENNEDFENIPKDKSKSIGGIEIKCEKDDKNRLRLKGLDEAKDKRLRKDSMDKIVSPVIPQPGAWKHRLQHRPNQEKKKKQHQQQAMPNFRQKDARYQYGNYNRYYGYRNPHHEEDNRLKVFARRKELFFRKDILDIGCNIGHITLSVARDFGARSVTGIDIDRTLINIARINVKHYVNCVQSPASNEDSDRKNDSDSNFFPMSMPLSYGPVDITGFTKHKRDKEFPYNVTFVQGNYVLDDDALLCSEQPQFDTILCLSITKWIHLNFGDAGLKRAFKRMHAQLRPNGVLVLEPQGWSSYSKKRNLTERIYKNYHSIEFHPQNFTQYLLSSEVGFCKCEVISIPPYPFKGFHRPIHLFTKAGERVEDFEDIPDRRERRECEELREAERIKYERELFPKSTDKESMSEISQQSADLGQYEQLENVYAPSATPCYDTPSHNNEQQVQDIIEMGYMLDVDTQNDKDTEMESVGCILKLWEERRKEGNCENKEEETKRVTNSDTLDDNKEKETGADKISENNKQMRKETSEVTDTDKKHDNDKEIIETDKMKGGIDKTLHKKIVEVKDIKGNDKC